MEQRSWPAYVAEFIGTFFLVFFIATIWSLHQVDARVHLGYQDFAVIGLLHAFVLMMLIHTLGGTSGGYFNPAVTVALTAIRKIRPSDAAVYIMLQLAGGIAAALVVKLVLSNEGGAADFGATTVSEKFLEGEALPGFLLELIGAFVLMWAIMGVAVNDRGRREWAGFVIGATLGFAVMAIGPLTGGGFNPARSFGPALVGEQFNGADDFLFVYVAGPLIGAVLAAFAYSAIVIGPQARVAERPVDKLP